MNIINSLRTLIAPELNLLYTSPPGVRGGVLDCGWFCREHALHTKVVCSLFGVSADIRQGEFNLYSFAVPHTTSGEDGTGHVWCRVKSTLPVDLSMTFQHFGAGAGPQLTGPVFGTGRNGDYLISYHHAADAEPQAPNHIHHIVFQEHAEFEYSAEDLTSNPYLLLHAPDPEEPLNWDAVHGTDIYARISFHCFAVATRTAKPIPRSLSAQDAAHWISAQYPSARHDVLAGLASV